MTDEGKPWRIQTADDLPGQFDRKLSDFLLSFKTSRDAPLWSPEYFRWKIDQNPAGKGAVSAAINDKGEIVSAVTITAKSISCKGVVIKTAEIGDTYTRDDFQRRGIFVALIGDITQRAQKKGFDFIYGLPNENSRPGYEKKCGFRSMASLHVNFCTSVIGVFRPLRFGLAILAAIWVGFARLAGVSVAPVERSEEINDDYDDLWQRCAKLQDCAVVRNKEYIQFRFFKHPLAEYRVYEARRVGKLVGYLVGRLRKIEGKEVLLVADWLYDHSSPFIFLALLNRMQQDYGFYPMEACSAWVNSASKEKLLFLLSGFVSHGRQHVIAFQNQSVDLDSAGSTWHFTIADSDNA